MLHRKQTSQEGGLKIDHIPLIFPSIYSAIDSFLFYQKYQAMFRVRNSVGLSTMSKRHTQNRCFVENIVHIKTCRNKRTFVTT